MKHAIVTLWGKYKYKISLKGNETLHDIAWKIALEVHNSEQGKKFTGTPRTYNYIVKCLQSNKTCFNFRANAENTTNNYDQFVQAANELQSRSEFVKKECSCMTKNRFKDCPICNGHGYIYERREYRLGYTQSNTLIIDIDGKNERNMLNVVLYYENILQCKFKVFSTNNGYWLFSDEKYKDVKSWVFDHCRVLCPSLELCCFEEYKKKLLNIVEINHKENQKDTPDIIKSSGLYHAPKDINFDVAFTFLSIKRERSTIRITKKHKNDKVELINI